MERNSSPRQFVPPYGSLDEASGDCDENERLKQCQDDQETHERVYKIGKWFNQMSQVMFYLTLECVMIQYDMIWYSTTADDSSSNNNFNSDSSI